MFPSNLPSDSQELSHETTGCPSRAMWAWKTSKNSNLMPCASVDNNSNSNPCRQTDKSVECELDCCAANPSTVVTGPWKAGQHIWLCRPASRERKNVLTLPTCGAWSAMVSGRATPGMKLCVCNSPSIWTGMKRQEVKAALFHNEVNYSLWWHMVPVEEGFVQTESLMIIRILKLWN